MLPKIAAGLAHAQNTLVLKQTTQTAQDSIAADQMIKITNKSHNKMFHFPILSVKCKSNFSEQVAGGFLISRESGYRIMYRSSSQAPVCYSQTNEIKVE